jgi:hypothetical protein
MYLLIGTCYNIVVKYLGMEGAMHADKKGIVQDLFNGEAIKDFAHGSVTLLGLLNLILGAASGNIALIEMGRVMLFGSYAYAYNKEIKGK